MAKLDAAGIDYRINPIESRDIVQVHALDPDGNHLEMQFPLAEHSQAAE